MTYVSYLWYVLRHKWWVLRYSLVVGADFWLCLWHDASKFSPTEFGPYARWFYRAIRMKCQTPAEVVEHDRLHEDFRRAWDHHKSRNKHHPECWCRDAHGYAIPMPERYVREMIADWMGAGRAITGKMEVREWYSKNKDRFTAPVHMHENTIRRVERILAEIE